jgi:hypothetical protein
MAVDPNRVIFYGENPGIKLGTSKDAEATTSASFWRTVSPSAPKAATGSAPRGAAAAHASARHRTARPPVQPK